MCIVFEISRPFQARPTLFTSKLTPFRFVWLWFALAYHPVRHDELLNMYRDGIAHWGKDVPHAR